MQHTIQNGNGGMVSLSTDGDSGYLDADNGHHRAVISGLTPASVRALARAADLLADELDRRASERIYYP